MEVVRDDLARDASAGEAQQHAHAREQHHHDRRTLSWHGLNVSVNLWNGMIGIHHDAVLSGCNGDTYNVSNATLCIPEPC
jgi:hypothetical protein